MPQSNRTHRSISFYSTAWLVEQLKKRIRELGMNNKSQYIRCLIDNDLWSGGDHEIKAGPSIDRGELNKYKFDSFSADEETAQRATERAARLDMSRSWYICRLIERDVRERGNLIIRERNGQRDTPPRVRRGKH